MHFEDSERLDSNFTQAELNRLEGDQQAQRDLWKFHYRRKYEHNPHLLGQKFTKLYDESIQLYDREAPYAYAVTVNPPVGSKTDTLQHFEANFLTGFIDSLDRKTGIKDYVFHVEAAPKTGRLHLHGTVRRKKCTRRTITCSEVQSQILACLPKEFKTMHRKTICVEPIFNEKGWENYETKNPLKTISKN